ncbi:hypothetical protein AVEN_169062-1 [Araneus ventricosus]|uniref:Uncharacterized protein n=1 Tax=Araneus ventricosus TaxID=182803 RepID=A0A4Y1ZKW9_ARAVE|nr:hypothetical protein AVEN_228407-1 [Araneus ventricosus]GBL55115.1 hypothetical protein AVEN_45228-1 [Araneus ventricosus]GBL55133.1 hypothetical protein AVEN_95461-1 [Araneus ventricosus]GBL55149.1 hypothetical protein AVEN_169062-1 [Araneus ventricosus]
MGNPFPITVLQWMTSPKSVAVNHGERSGFRNQIPSIIVSPTIADCPIHCGVSNLLWKAVPGDGVYKSLFLFANSSHLSLKRVSAYCLAEVA